MNIVPVNNYNNKVSFKHLLPVTNKIPELEMLNKIFQNPEIKEFVKHYHDLGIDIFLSKSDDKHIKFSRPIIAEMISGKLSFNLGQKATLHIDNNMLDKFKAKEAIEKFDNDYQEKLNTFLRYNQDYAMFDKFNREFK